MPSAMRILRRSVPLTAADHFRIGSNTKTFVVSVILQLIAEGKLSLDDPVSRFSLGVTIPNGDNITVRELCNMRSGLFEAYATPQFAALNMIVPEGFDPRTLVAWAVKQKPYFAPGKGYHYSNTNYLLLGLIIEKLTNDSVGNEIRKRLIVPFGLSQTTIRKRKPCRIRGRAATGSTRSGIGSTSAIPFPSRSWVRPAR